MIIVVMKKLEEERDARYFAEQRVKDLEDILIVCCHFAVLLNIH